MANTRSGAPLVLHDNKVYQVLRQFDSVQVKRLVKFLQSPYFVQGKILPRLGELLLESLERNREGFYRETIWQQLFPGEPYDDVNFRKYCSDLLKQIEDFMAVEMLRNDDTRRSLATLEFVVSQKLEPLYNSALRQTRSQLEKSPYRAQDFFRHQFRIERLYYAMMDFDVKQDLRCNIEEISFNIDVFYWLEKIKLYSAALSQRKTRMFEYGLLFVQDLIQQVAQFPLEEVPVLAAYYYSLLTLVEEDQLEHYYNLRSMLERFADVMPQSEAIHLYDSALHYCTGKLNKGNRVFLQEYFNLFEVALNKNIFTVNGIFASWRYNNIIGVAVQLGKLEWAEQFVTNYKNLLPAETRENTTSFNLARVYRYQGKFSEVLKLLRNVEYKDPGYNRISKAMLVITYYELKEYDALDSFVESFRAYLIRNKAIPEATRQSYLNLLKFVRRLMRLPPNDKTGIEKLRSEIEAEKRSTINHDWLLEKIAQLE